MKNINVVFEDDEYRRLVEIKGDLSWHDLILELVPKPRREVEPEKPHTWKRVSPAEARPRERRSYTPSRSRF